MNGVYSPGVYGPFFEYRQRTGQCPENVDMTVAASTTIQFGDIVAYDGSQNIVQAIALPGSDGTGTLSGGNLKTVGIAVGSIVTNAAGQEATTARTTVAVVPWDWIQVALPVALVNGAALAPSTLSAGTSYQFGRYRLTSTQWWYFLSATTTNGEFRYDELVIPGTSADNYAPVWGRYAISDTVRAF